MSLGDRMLDDMMGPRQCELCGISRGRHLHNCPKNINFTTEKRRPAIIPDTLSVDGMPVGSVTDLHYCIRPNGTQQWCLEGRVQLKMLPIVRSAHEQEGRIVTIVSETKEDAIVRVLWTIPRGGGY